ncbi:E3 ubiquitin-protein ligase TRIM56-like [Haliotis cracherodii]|uniref:E3 ubiquitin-protein ligase TRIM56-like n=1 Tax=Haliotis cracherodii TaxID=6455 RepID=UPI0039EB04AF
MAAARKLERLNENLLSCSICTEGYKDPCTLTCGHTFCKGCLGEFLETRQDAITAKSILCPYCRQMTRAPRPDRPVEEWVKQIKPSFLIQGLLDTLACEENLDDGTDNCCCFCQKLGDKNPAISCCQDCDVPLCERCVKMHMAVPATSNHTIADLGGAVKITGKERPICKDHNEVVDVCCRDCNKAICQKCCTIYHRKCDSVVTLESLMSEMESVLEQNKKLITQRFDESNKYLLQHRSQIDDISHNKDTVESQIRQASQKAMDVIKQKEKQLLEELHEMTEKQSGQLRGWIKSGEIDMQVYQQYIEYITQVLKSGSETDMFDIYQMCQSGAINEATGRDVDFTDRISDSQPVFVSEIDVKKFDKDVRLGRIKHNTFDVIEGPFCNIQDDSFNIKSTVLHQTFDIRVEGDKKKPDPADVAVVVVDGVEALVVSDYNNNCLKSLYTKNNQSLYSKLDLASEPLTVTRLSDNQIVVSFWSRNEIVTVRVTPDLVLESRVPTQKTYRCLTALSPSSLAAGCWHPPCVDILDVSGRVLKSISALSTGDNLISRPRFLCSTNEGNILVSDGGCVYCITPEGDVVFIYNPKGDRRLRGPQGMTTTSTGHIFVADNWADKVVLLTAAGGFVRDLLTSQDGIEKPFGLFLCGQKLYVAQQNETVKVYTSQ